MQPIVRQLSANRMLCVEANALLLHSRSPIRLDDRVSKRGELMYERFCTFAWQLGNRHHRQEFRRAEV
jgi:urease accessory protein UreE